jgi:hypothetical protein
LLRFEEVMKQIEAGIPAFPQKVQAAVGKALRVSTARIMESYQAQKITGKEAAHALEMMREILEALVDVHKGQAVIQESEKTDNVHVWRIRSPDGDEVVVTARSMRDDHGDPRIAFRHMVDDGKRLPGRHRMGVRIDLEKWGKASVDVQFGGASLDKRIHGLMKDENGEVFTTATGKKLADHHFRTDLPSEIRAPQNFANMVQDFVDGKMNLPDNALVEPPQRGAP